MTLRPLRQLVTLDKRQYTIAAVAMLALAVLCGWSAGRLQTKRSITLQSATIDLGSVESRSTVNTTFPVQCSAGHPAPLRDLKTSCSCTVASGLPSIFSANKLYHMGLTIHVGDRPGAATWTVLVRYGQDKMTAFTVRANVIESIPNDVRFSDALQGDRKTLVFPVHGPEGGRIKISQMYYDHQYFDVRLSDEPTGTGKLVTIIQSTEIPVGGFEKDLTLLLDEPNALPRVIRVHGRVAGEIQIDPQAINFGLISREIWVEGSVKLQDATHRVISVVGFRSDRPEHAKIDLNRIRQINNEVIVPVSVRIGARDRALVGSIDVTVALDGSAKHAEIKYLAGPID